MDALSSAYYARSDESERFILVSPASPLKAIKVLLFKLRVLSSEALRIVAPLMAAFDAAMRVKSFPVIPRRTSLRALY